MGLTIDNGILIHMNIIIYPLAILLLPVNTPKFVQLLSAFLLGIAIDFFYNSPGVNAATCVLLAFSRSFLLNRLEPRGGYNVDSVLTLSQYGFKWFITYSSIFMGAFLLVLFSIQQFTFVFIHLILLKTILSFIISMLFIVVYMFLFNPKE
jgi:hypothetical protein